MSNLVLYSHFLSGFSTLNRHSQMNCIWIIFIVKIFSLTWCYEPKRWKMNLPPQVLFDYNFYVSSYTVPPINYHQVPLRLSTYLCSRGCLITMRVSLYHNPVLLFLCVPLPLLGPLGLWPSWDLLYHHSLVHVLSTCSL